MNEMLPGLAGEKLATPVYLNEISGLRVKHWCHPGRGTSHRGLPHFVQHHPRGRLRDGRFTTFNRKQGLSNDTVFALQEDRQGSLWIGTDSGLNRMTKDGRFEIFTANMGLSNDSVLALHEDREGSLWIGTYAGGLNRLQDGRFTSFTTKEGLSNNTVNVIHEDREGALWIFGALALILFVITFIVLSAAKLMLMGLSRKEGVK